MPPSALTSLAQQVWKAAMTSRCSSASRRVESALDPTMSQNMTVNCRRSGVDAVPAAAWAILFGASAKLAPHSGQNFAPGGQACPQLEHGRANGVPHSWQNLAPSGATALQVGHSTPAPKTNNLGNL